MLLVTICFYLLTIHIMHGDICDALWYIINEKCVWVEGNPEWESKNKGIEQFCASRDKNYTIHYLILISGLMCMRGTVTDRLL